MRHVSDRYPHSIDGSGSLFLDTEGLDPINALGFINFVCTSSWNFLVINQGFSLVLMFYCVVYG
jgi:hypothetical protein